MVEILWTEEAVSNLREIEEYIARDNIEVAIDFVNKIIDQAEELTEHPKKGRVVPELSIDNIRELIYNNYRIVYLIKEKSIDILTVFESHKLLNIEK